MLQEGKKKKKIKDKLEFQIDKEKDTPDPFT